MYKKLACLITLFLLFGLSSGAQASVYYVSPAGNDSKAGTSAEQAWKTINKVNVTTFKAGDSILFEGGQTFRGSLKFGAADSGTRAKPVTVGSYGKGRATISSGSRHGLHAKDCGGFIVKDLIFVGSGIGDAKGKKGIYFFTDKIDDKPEYIRIDNVKISGYRWEGIHIAGAMSSNSGFRDVRITNAEVHDNGDKGISFRGSQPRGDWVHKDIYVGNCRVYDNVGIAGKKGHTGNGIILSSVDGAIIEFCEGYNNGQFCDDPNSGGPIGIWAWDSHDVVIQYCEAYDNKTGNKKDGGGFDLDGGCVSCVMQYNYSHDNYGAGYGIYQYSGAREYKDNVIRYNISENDGLDGRYGGINLWSTNSSGGVRDTKVYNNTVYITRETKGAAIADLPYTEGESYVYNTKVYNNIFVSTAGKQVVDMPQPSGGWSFKGNCYWTYGGDIAIRWGDKTYTNLDEWRKATGQERIDGKDVGFEADPQLVNAGGGGTIGDAHKLASLTAYKLKQSSPLIDAGLDIKKLFGIDAGKRDYYGAMIAQGRKFDVGAQEFVQSKMCEGPVGWWKFDEGSGTTARNSGRIGSCSDGELNNMDDGDWVSGIAGKALEFDGIDDDVMIAVLGLNSNTVTISAWVKREGEQSAYAGIVFSRDGDTIAGVGLGSTGEPQWQANQELYYGWNDAEGTWKFHSGLIIPDGKWVFVALVLEPKMATLYLREDEKLSSAINSVEHSTEEFNGVSRIGNDKKPGFPSRYFKGMIDDVRVYGRALSAEEIKQLAQLP